MVFLHMFSLICAVYVLRNFDIVPARVRISVRSAAFSWFTSLSEHFNCKYCIYKLWSCFLNVLMYVNVKRSAVFSWCLFTLVQSTVNVPYFYCLFTMFKKTWWVLAISCARICTTSFADCRFFRHCHPDVKDKVSLRSAKRHSVGINYWHISNRLG